jgi:hypothetical protein
MGLLPLGYFICMGIFKFHVLARRVCYNMVSELLVQHQLVWAKINVNLVKFVVIDFGSVTDLGKIVKPE